MGGGGVGSRPGRVVTILNGREEEEGEAGARTVSHWVQHVPVTVLSSSRFSCSSVLRHLHIGAVRPSFVIEGGAGVCIVRRVCHGLNCHV